MNIGKFPKEFHWIVGEKKRRYWFSVLDRTERERERIETGGKGNPVFLLAPVGAAESLRNRREADKLAAKQAAISLRVPLEPEVGPCERSVELSGAGEAGILMGSAIEGVEKTE